MPFNGSATPEQLATLSKVFDDYCKRNAIEDESEREHISALVVGAFTAGARSPDDLMASVERMMASELRRQA
jgi:hypothetical protein